MISLQFNQGLSEEDRQRQLTELFQKLEDYLNTLEADGGFVGETGATGPAGPAGSGSGSSNEPVSNGEIPNPELVFDDITGDVVMAA